MATNASPQFLADIEGFIASETLALTRRQLVLYNFADKETLPKGRGTTYTATRYNRVPLPYAPLAEGTPPPGETMQITQVTASVQQWGDKITITDVAEMTIKHPVVNEAKKLIALQSAECMERNTFNAVNAMTQVNYVNSRGARASLVAGDVLNTFEITRAYAQLLTLGVPRFMGDEETNRKIDAKDGTPQANANPRSRPHFVAITHPFVEADVTQNSTFVLASAYSDINNLYNAEIGQWHSVRFCSSNMVPFWTGQALITGTPGTSGSLATFATYNIIVTLSDNINQYEQIISQISGNLSVTGPNGSISVVLPAASGFTYNIYVGTTATVANLGVCAAGPTQGSMQGQATQLAPGQTVVITGIGVAQTPPAAPATGVTVYPTYIFGRGAFSVLTLDEMKLKILQEADKSDPLNQLRIIGYKFFNGNLIKNNLFALRVESTSAFNTTFG